MPTITMPKGVFAVPEHYLKLNAAPDDPPYSTPFGSESGGYQAFVMIYPIHIADSMPYGNPKSLIAGIHAQLGENQGLIEVESGKTTGGREYIYSIVKTLQGQGMGVQYNLTMHVSYETYAMNITGFFDEKGVTGYRDATIYELRRRENKVSFNGAGWTCDPYDTSYTKGRLMNLSENRQYDTMFPEHPLTEVRKFADYTIKNN